MLWRVRHCLAAAASERQANRQRPSEGFAGGDDQASDGKPQAQDSTVLPPATQEQVADALEDDAEVLSNARLHEQLAGQPAEIRDEIIRINTDARPLVLQVALLLPTLAGLLGLLNGFRMLRRPDPAPSDAAEMALG